MQSITEMCMLVGLALRSEGWVCAQLDPQSEVLDDEGVADIIMAE